MNFNEEAACINFLTWQYEHEITCWHTSLLSDYNQLVKEKD